MGASRLGIYNQALRICGERRLSSLTEAREPRRLLDDVWSQGGVNFCLEEGFWNFALRPVRVDYDPSVATAYGLTYGFSKPSDWIRTAAFTSDERYMVPYRLYKDEPGYWFADITPIYVVYVSNDAGFGGNLVNWTSTFTQFVSAYFASEIVTKLTNDKERVQLVNAELKRRKRDALNKDAMNLAEGIPFRGSWSRARGGGRSPWRDGGSRSNLIG